jgi:hypothetical protein
MSVALTVVDDVVEVETRRYPETPDLLHDERWETVIRPSTPPVTEDIFEVLGPLATQRDAEVMHERAVEYVVRALDTTVRPRRSEGGTALGP